MSWSEDHEAILERLRVNCVNMSSQHKSSYFFYKKSVKYMRLPTIMLSSIGSVSSVGLTSYLQQNHISALTCALALIVSILNSIELFLRLSETCEMENECSKAYYAIGVHIQKTLMLQRSHRPMEGSIYLEKKYSEYMVLVEKSNMLSGSIKDRMMEIPKTPSKIKNLIKKKNSNSSSSSSSSGNSIESPLPKEDDMETQL